MEIDEKRIMTLSYVLPPSLPPSLLATQREFILASAFSLTPSPSPALPSSLPGKEELPVELQGPLEIHNCAFVLALEGGGERGREGSGVQMGG